MHGDSPSLIFPLARMEAREPHYIWIAKIFPARFAFCSEREPFLDMETARDYKIAVHDNAPPAMFLESHGFDKLYRLPAGVGTIPRMLMNERVHAWFSEVNLIAFGLRGTPLEDTVECGPTALEVWQYIAGSKNLPQETVEAYRKTIKAMQEEGVIEKIMLRYLPKKAFAPLPE